MKKLIAAKGIIKDGHERIEAAYTDGTYRLYDSDMRGYWEQDHPFTN